MSNRAVVALANVGVYWVSLSKIEAPGSGATAPGFQNQRRLSFRAEVGHGRFGRQLSKVSERQRNPFVAGRSRFDGEGSRRKAETGRAGAGSRSRSPEKA